MDQITAHSMSPAGWTVESLSRFMAASIDAARGDEIPFTHLVLRDFFPGDVYRIMLDAMPEAADYRPMSGRAAGLDAADGTHTRVKIDLFPEYVRHLPRAKRAIWTLVGEAVRSDAVKAAFVRRLAAPLARRFGDDFQSVGFYPIPVLTRDIPGYRIYPHPDTQWKGITVQLYLPRDDAYEDIGTIFHERLPDGSMPKRAKMSFIPNSGYAFAVDQESWHSADPVREGVTTRDSILLTYFVDAGALRVLRNRGKRIGNLLLNEARHAFGGRAQG